MSEIVEYTEIETAGGAERVEEAPVNGVDGLDRLRDVPVDLAVEIGRTRMTIGEALALAPGSIIGLNRMAGDPVELLVNGKPIARGEVVVIDEEFGLRVTEIVGSIARAPEAVASVAPPEPQE